MSLAEELWAFFNFSRIIFYFYYTFCMFFFLCVCLDCFFCLERYFRIFWIYKFCLFVNFSFRWRVFYGIFFCFYFVLVVIIVLYYVYGVRYVCSWGLGRIGSFLVALLDCRFWRAAVGFDLFFCVLRLEIWICRFFVKIVIAVIVRTVCVRFY